MKQLLSLWLRVRCSRRLPGMCTESGQSIVIVTFAFLGLLAMLGVALDVGLVYIERVRLKRTVDAAALAAVTELPVEEEAMRRAMGYLSENGYDITQSKIYVAGCVQDIRGEFFGNTDTLINLPAGIDWDTWAPNQTVDPEQEGDWYLYIDNGLPDNEAPAFFMDTRSFQDREDATCDTGQQVSGAATSYGSSSRIKVHGRVPVRMNFMQFFGFSEVMVSDSATAENASTLDVAVVLDTTGSMEYDTICYGCWARCGNTDYDDNNYNNHDAGDYNGNNAGLIPPGECDETDRYKTYPENGRSFPYDYDGVGIQSLINDNGGEPRPEDSDNYIVMEAEFYTNNFSSWEPGYRSAGKGYWAIQRDWEARAYSVDGYGYGGNSLTDPQHLSGLVRHHPYLTTNGGNAFGKNYSIEDAQSNTAPVLEYDFIPTWNGTATYIHLRAQVYNDTNQGFYWAIAERQIVDGELWPGPTVVPLQSKSGGGNNDGNRNARNNWTWIADNTGAVNLTAGKRYTLKVWAGSVGYAIDRIIITSRSDIDNSPGPDLRELPATEGSMQGIAADPCNPIYGRSVHEDDCTHMKLNPGDTLDNDENAIFGALEPIRGAQTAIRNFVARLTPNLDQAGFVDFAQDGWQRSQLECMRGSRARLADVGGDVEDQVAGYPLDAATYGESDETTCFDPANAAGGTVPISYTNVFIAIEDAYPPSGNTDIADGLRRGLHMLGINTDDDDGQNHANDCAWDENNDNWRLPRRDGAWLNQPFNPDSSTNPIVSHCARGQAANGIIVLLTDGAPTNKDPGDVSNNSQIKSYEWNDETQMGTDNGDCNDSASNPTPYEGFSDNDSKYRCIMYYADIAAANGILVYTIGLGVGADQDLMRAVAETTNGRAYFVLTASQLDAIFDQILANVYIRLID